ncbi:uncharacterized protein G2W53_022264 [Senna tora]|uniref:Uncharacterized protein n=1 Tax=Senna tora TaxID=362788 RepID=A0A834WHZ7_9FABA|nr:uncharacterized protein G2W53_022264 [Senna tora]
MEIEDKLKMTKLCYGDATDKWRRQCKFAAIGLKR